MVRRGKTPVLSAEEARKLLDSIDASSLMGVRDRVLIGTTTKPARSPARSIAGLQFCPGRRSGDDAGRRLFPASQAVVAQAAEKGGKR